MKRYSLKHVDAFTVTPFAGNFAGVVLDAEGLTDIQMQLIAREKNLSETAFVLPPSGPQADVRLRWFTPGEEVPLCGHATVAAFHALTEAGLRGLGSYGRKSFRLETRSGILEVNVDKSNSGTTVELEIPIPKFRKVAALSDLMIQALRMETIHIDGRFPMVADTYLYVPVQTLKGLHDLRPDFHLLSEACTEGRVVGVCVFTLETLEKTSAVHSRFFAPGLGVNEDPVTGSANGPLGYFLATAVRAAGIDVPQRELSDGRTELVGEQGDVLNRPGRVLVRLMQSGTEVKRLWIAGSAVTIMDSTLQL